MCFWFVCSLLNWPQHWDVVVKVSIDKEWNIYSKHKDYECDSPKNLTYICTTKWASEPCQNMCKILWEWISRTKFLVFPSNYSEISCCWSIITIHVESMLTICNSAWNISSFVANISILLKIFTTAVKNGGEINASY